MTKEEYQKNLDKIYNGRYILKSDCTRTSDVVIIEDTICGKTFEKVANEFTRTKVQERYKKFCPKCKPSRSRSLKDIQNELDILTNNRVKIIDYGMSMHSKSKLQCTICNNVWENSIHSLIGNLKRRKSLDSFGCSSCSNKKKKTQLEFENEIFKIYKNDIKIIGKYINTNTPITCQCRICNSLYNPYPVDLLYKYKSKNGTNGCPNCNMEKNESSYVKYIKNILDDLNILYEQEVRFSDCKYKNTLPFDFGIKKNNKYFLIEYDGRQHDFGWMGNPSTIEIQKKRDSIKNKYCIDNGIPLLRLSYTNSQEEIKNMLYNFLEENNISSL